MAVTRAPGQQPGPATEVAELALVRRLLLLVLAGAMFGLLVELVLLEHYESRRQYIPFIALGVSLVTIVIALVRPRRVTILALRGVMLALLFVSLLGLYFHFSGNIEFELEMDPALRGRELVWKSLTGATPSLAPGTLVLFGLVGLISTYGHPALGSTRRRSEH